MINHRNKVPRSSRDGAAYWLMRLNEPDIETDELEAFSAWRAKSPNNRAAYERLEDLVESMRTLSSDPDIERAVGDAIARGRKRALKAARPQTKRWRMALVGGLVAATVVVGAIVVWRQPTYSTGVGQTFSARLEDGSRLQLSTDSAVRVRFSKGERHIDLIRGQALFEVAHNAARPFIVTAADTQVRAVGTRFEVRRQGETVRVTLAQGSVMVTDKDAPRARWRLSPGQSLALSPTAPSTTKPVAVDAAMVTSWTTGNLVFQGETLADAVAELNRYSREKIILAPGTPTGRHVSGVFPAGETSDFVAAVSSAFGLTSVTLANGDVKLQPKIAVTS